MNTYRFCYSVDGVLTMLPLYVIVKADNKEKAITEAEKKIKETDTFVKMGYTFKIHHD